MRIRLVIRKLRVHSLPGRQHSFMKIWSWNIFSVILSFLLIQIGQLSVSGERMCTILVNCLEDQACPVKMWLGKLTVLNMTPSGWLGHKTSSQTKAENGLVQISKQEWVRCYVIPKFRINTNGKVLVQNTKIYPNDHHWSSILGLCSLLLTLSSLQTNTYLQTV